MPSRLSFSGWGRDKTLGPVAVWNPPVADEWKAENGKANILTETDVHSSAGYHVQFMEKPKPGSHNLIPLSSSSNKACAVCKLNNIRTATGLPTKSYYKCDQCDVCLCRPQFVLFCSFR